MKKIFILIAVLLISVTGFAQRSSAVHPVRANVAGQNHAAFTGGGTRAKTTANGDTTTLFHVLPTDTLTFYKVGADSGYARGTNFWGDKAYAERYVVNDTNSTLQVIGVIALFTGRVSASSAHTVSFNIWSQGLQQAISGTRFYSGFPAALLNTYTTSVNHLGIGTTADTITGHFFAAPTTSLTGAFFAGYNINYNFGTLAGDTIGLATSTNGERAPGSFFTLEYHISDFGDTVLDTIITVQNATLYTDNRWHDNYTDNDSLANNLAIYPVVVLGFPTSVQGITRNNLTFYGSYPNPATDAANIKFSLATVEEVTIQLMDMNGRILTAVKKSFTTGEHIVPVSTTNLATGEYLYLIRTSSGDGMAGKIIKE